MKNKMIGIFVIILLIVTALPTVGTINEITVQDLGLRSDPQRVGFSSTIPDDIYFNQQYSLHNTGQTGGTPDADIDAPEAWDIETGDSEIVIAFLDSGIDYTHPDLDGKIWINTDEIPNNGIDDDGNGYIDDIRGWDFYDDDNDPLDQNGHGTICAGIAAAETNNGIGIAGVCWDCKIMPLKVNGLYNTEDIPSYWIEGIEYAVDNGADIISMSLGIEYYHEQLENAVNYAYNNGVFLTASAGNQGWSNEHYPAAYNNVVGVAATNDEDKRMENAGQWGATSNYGPWVSVAAPGEDIFSTMPTYHVTFNDYGFNYDYMGGLCGTSCSAPHVAGLAALLLSQDPSLSPDDLKALICENVDPYNSSYDLGSGRINTYKALIALKNTPDAPIINGPVSGRTNVEYEYLFVAVDPNDDEIYYYIDWNDDNVEEWIGPFASGEEIILNHIWVSSGIYEIKAKVKDIYNFESEWSDTFLVTINENHPPGVPTIHGPPSGKPEVEYDYIFNSEDPDSDDVRYYIDWGDGNSDTTEYNPSGTNVLVKHTWSEEGTYTIRATAEDTYGLMGLESTMTVTMPRNKQYINTPFQWFLQSHPNIFPILQMLLQRLGLQ